MYCPKEIELVRNSEMAWEDMVMKGCDCPVEGVEAELGGCNCPDCGEMCAECLYADVCC